LRHTRGCDDLLGSLIVENTNADAQAILPADSEPDSLLRSLAGRTRLPALNLLVLAPALQLRSRGLVLFLAVVIEEEFSKVRVTVLISDLPFAATRADTYVHESPHPLGLQFRAMPNKKVMVQLSSNISRACPLCQTFSIDGDQMESSMNHMLAHGLKCLHVGQETIADDQGKPWHTTVAVFSS
jgi:hypothetical protein